MVGTRSQPPPTLPDISDDDDDDDDDDDEQCAVNKYICNIFNILNI